MTSIEERLVATLDELDLPEADVVEAVLARIDDPDGARATVVPIRRGMPRLAIAAALVLIVSAVVVAITPPARQAVARWFGIGATKVEVVPVTTPGGSASPTTAGATPAPDAPVAPRPTSIGTAVTVDADPIPALGPPSASAATGTGRSYAWPPVEGRPELGDTGVAVVLTVRPEAGELDLKRVAADVGVEFVSVVVGGEVVPGLWIDGEHEYVAAGSATPVLADRVLIWVADGLQYRLEAGIGRDDVVALAESVEGGTDLLRPG